MASGTYKHGRRSKYMPAPLLETYQRTLLDPEILSLNEDIATAEALIEEALLELGSANGDGPDPKIRARIVDLTEIKRKLSVSEAVRREKMQSLIPVEDAVMLFRQLAEIVKEHVTDQTELAAIVDDWSRFSGRLSLSSADPRGNDREGAN